MDMAEHSVILLLKSQYYSRSFHLRFSGNSVSILKKKITLGVSNDFELPDKRIFDSEENMRMYKHMQSSGHFTCFSTIHVEQWTIYTLLNNTCRVVDNSLTSQRCMQSSGQFTRFSTIHVEQCTIHSLFIKTCRIVDNQLASYHCMQSNGQSTCFSSLHVKQWQIHSLLNNT